MIRRYEICHTTLPCLVPPLPSPVVAGLLEESMTSCTNCGRKVSIHIAPWRNPGSYHHSKHKSLKDHDLCRQCFKSIMTSERAKLLGPKEEPA